MKLPPTPWTFKDECAANQYAILDAEGNWIVSLLHNGEAMPVKQARVLQLMTAAPELLAALEAIATLDPEHDSENGYNECGEAECFTKAQVIAQAALLKVNSVT